MFGHLIGVVNKLSNKWLFFYTLIVCGDWADALLVKYMNKKLMIIALALTMVTSTMVGCLGDDDEPVDDGTTTVKIGLLSPQTGPIAVYADGFEDAAGVAITELNGMDAENFVFELVVADSGCDATQAATAAQSLIDAGVLAIAGAACSGATLGAIAVAKEAGVPMVSYASTSPAVTAADDDGLLFRVVPSDSLQSIALAAVTAVTDGTNYGVVYMTNDYGAGLADGFETAMGGSLCAKIGYDQDGTDFSSTVSSLASSDCDGVLLVSYATDGAAILEEMALQNVSMEIMGADGVADAGFVEEFSDWTAVDGMVATKPAPASDSVVKTGFDTAYTAAGGDASGIYTHATYDATMVIGKAAMMENGASMKEHIGMVGINYDGASGTHTFDAAGDVGGTGYEVCVFDAEDADTAADVGFNCPLSWTVAGGVAFSGTTTTIKIGLLSPQTGPIAVYSTGFEDSANIAISVLNTLTIWDGYNYELVVADSGCDGTQAATAAQSLIDAGVSAIAGAACSGATLGAIAVAKEAGIPMVSYASTSPAITTADDDNLLYRVVPSDDLQATELAQIVAAANYSSPAVVYMTNDYDSGLADFFNASWDGGACAMIGYDQAATDFSTIVSSLASSGCDSVVLVSYATDGAAILEEIALQNLSIGLFGADGVADSAFQNEFSDVSALDGLVATKPGSAATSEYSVMFTALYAATGGSAEAIYTAETFDAVLISGYTAMVADQLGLDILSAIQFLAGEPFEGASGTHSFDANGDVAGNGYTVCTFSVEEVIIDNGPDGAADTEDDVVEDVVTFDCSE